MPRLPSCTVRLLLVLVSVSLAACGGGSDGGAGGGGADAGPRDAGNSDAGPGDAGPGDAGPGDAGTALSAPTHVLAVATSPSSVKLTWVAPAGALVRFELERGTTPGGPFTALATPAASETGFTDVGLSAGTTYVYRVRAVDAAGASPWSAEASATPLSVTPTVPVAPGGLLVVPLSATSLYVEWVDQSDDETGFEVERAPSASGPFVLVHTTGADTLSWTDSTGLAPATAYYYRVRAVNAAGASASTSVVGSTTAATPAPAAPTGLGVVQEVTGSTAVLRVSWTDAATNESGYELQRSGDAQTWGATVALAAGASAYVDASATFGTNHYRVRAVNAGGASAWVTASGYNGPFVSGYLCPATEGTSATAQGETSIRLAWTWNSCGGVAIERAGSSGGPWTELARLGNYVFPQPATGSYDDVGLAPGTAFFYRFRTLPLMVPSGWTSSGYSTPVSATTPLALPAPSGLTATVTSATEVSLAWTDVSSQETGYALEYATAAAGPFTEFHRVAANVTTAGARDLTPATAYWMRVRALKGTVLSAPSNVVAFTSATRVQLRTTGDATVMKSTATPANEDIPLPSGPNDVGCFFTWTVGPTGQALFHNCGGSALRFDTSALAGRTILRAALVMVPCSLAPHPVDDARYLVRALASAWNPATVTFTTLPLVYPAGAWWVPAPKTGAAQAWDVTPIVANWASGTWAQNGLFVEQSPITNRVPYWSGQYWDNQDQVTSYCSLEQNGGSVSRAPTLEVDYR